MCDNALFFTLTFFSKMRRLADTEIYLSKYLRYFCKLVSYIFLNALLISYYAVHKRGFIHYQIK